MSGCSAGCGALVATDRISLLRAWCKRARREFKVLGLPLLRPIQIATALDRGYLPWLRSEDAASKRLEALQAHLQASGDHEAMRLLAEYQTAVHEADCLEGGRATLMGLELDYLRAACWGDLWRDQELKTE